MIRIFLFCLSVVWTGTLLAQVNRTFVEHIRTLMVTANGNWNKAPVMPLNGRGHVEIAFDDLTHEYRRYVYKVELCNYDWSVNENALEMDYMTGFNNGQPIETYESSFNTTQIYTHYSFRIPNENIRLTAAGNYRVTIWEDGGDEDEPIAWAFFSVVNPQVVLSAEVSSDTDIDRNAGHQQMDLSVTFNRLQVRDPRNEIKVVVRQNYRWDNASVAPAVNYITANGMQWTHNKALIFDAGNEYRKYEILDLHVPTMGVDHIRWFSPFYHATLLESEPNANYIYTEDQNGAYLIRNEENTDNEIQSDYLFVHYTLRAEELKDAQVYVCGRWNRDFSDENRMTYNAETGCYEASIFQKQGYYNYQFLTVEDGAGEKKTGLTGPMEGNFYQTENVYDVFVYHRAQGARYDTLVGYAEVPFNGNN